MFNSNTDLKYSMKSLKATVILICLPILVALVNPFDLTTDNMARISVFDLLLPRKVYYKLPEHH